MAATNEKTIKKIHYGIYKIPFNYILLITLLVLCFTLFSLLKRQEKEAERLKLEVANVESTLESELSHFINEPVEVDPDARIKYERIVQKLTNIQQKTDTRDVGSSQRKSLYIINPAFETYPETRWNDEE